MNTRQFNPCVLVPTFNNPDTIAAVVHGVRAYVKNVIIVDDGSGPEGREVCERIAERGLAYVVHRPSNGGKGAAVKTGFAKALELGFTHALQVDADGQHDLACVPKFLSLGVQNPEALILGFPEYDASAPRIRRWARKFTQLWVDLEVGRGVIRDAMVGFRLYPVQAALGARAKGNRMDFDVEIPVRLAWQGVRIINVQVPIRYLSQEEGGVSHFQPLRDNLRFSVLHTRLCCSALFRRVFRRFSLLPRNAA